MEHVPTIALHSLSNAEKNALRIADNRLAQKFGWDVDLLCELMVDLQAPEAQIDLQLTGVSVGEIDVLPNEKPTAPDDDDVSPATPADSRAKAGDIWILSAVRLTAEGHNLVGPTKSQAVAAAHAASASARKRRRIGRLIRCF